MRHQVLLDTGPLVAVLNRRDVYHGWASGQWARIEPPLLTCEAVLSEACFLLQSVAGGPKAVMELIQRGIIDPAFHLADHRKPVARLMAKYASVPMSLADACLVRMSELQSDSAVLTLGRDFRLYRKHVRHVVPVIMPEDR